MDRFGYFRILKLQPFFPTHSWYLIPSATTLVEQKIGGSQGRPSLFITSLSSAGVPFPLGRQRHGARRDVLLARGRYPGHGIQFVRNDSKVRSGRNRQLSLASDSARSFCYSLTHTQTRPSPFHSSSNSAGQSATTPVKKRNPRKRRDQVLPQGAGQGNVGGRHVRLREEAKPAGEVRPRADGHDPAAMQRVGEIKARRASVLRAEDEGRGEDADRSPRWSSSRASSSSYPRRPTRTVLLNVVETQKVTTSPRTRAPSGRRRLGRPLWTSKAVAWAPVACQWALSRPSACPRRLFYLFAS